MHFTKINGQLFIGFFLLLLMASCVSTQKYQKVLYKRDALAAQAINDQRRVNNLNREIRELKADNNKCYAQYQELQKNSGAISGEQSQNSTQIDYEISNKQEELRSLQQQITQKRNALTQNSPHSQGQGSDKQHTARELEKLLSDKEEAEQQLMYQLKQAFREVLPEGAVVQRRKGRIYVSFAEWLLFNDEQTNISEPGSSALRNLAKVLRQSNDLDVLVEGHADNKEQEVNGKDASWNFSLNRANMIANALIERYGLEPERIIVAGRGLYYPIASNQTEEGRSKNRRIEIILEPNLFKLYDFLQINQTVIRKEREKR